MAGDEPEYEVESILGAKVVKKRKKEWVYWVKWKNYPPEYNTWEPQQSFQGGSEHFIERFWKRIKLNERDPLDLAQFTVGEEFLPSGPPVEAKDRSGKRARKEKGAKASVASPQHSESEVQSLVGETGRSSKRRRTSGTRRTAESYTKKIKRTSRGPVHESPGRQTGSSQRRGQAINKSTRSAASGLGTASPHFSGAIHGDIIWIDDDALTTLGEPSSHGEASNSRASTEGLVEAALMPSSVSSSSSHQAEKLLDTMGHDDQPDIPFATSSLAALSKRQLPAHRARKANPRVRALDDPKWSAPHEGTITTKRRLRNVSASANGSRANAGPGRSSRGFVHTSAEASSSMMGSMPKSAGAIESTDDAHENLPKPGDRLHAQITSTPGEHPPSGQELLLASGYDKDASEALPAFEDGMADSPNVLHYDNANQTPHSAPLVSQNAVADPQPNIAAWKLSTIFGPLTIGSENREHSHPSVNVNTQEDHTSLFIALDNILAIPTLLKDITPRGSLLASLGTASRGLSGKFYRGEHAHALLRAIRPSGSTARLAHAEERSRQYFRKFLTCLEDDALFVSVINGHLLVMCASENTAIGQKLEVPPTLLGLSSIIVITAVTIEDPSVYADAAEHAEDNHW